VSFSIEDVNSSVAVNPLHGLGLKNLLSALFFIASQFKGLIDTRGKHLSPSLKNAEMHVLLCKAWEVFENWPNNYFSFLEWRREQTTKSQAVRGLRKDFSEYKTALYKQLGATELKFIQSSFEEYLATQWDGGYIGHLKRLSYTLRCSGKYASRRESKDLLKVSVDGIDKLISINSLKAVVRQQGKSRLILIDRASLQAFKRELEQSLYLKQVEYLLGVSHKRILELVHYKLLNPLRGPTVDGCSDWRFSEEEVKGLLSKIEKKVKLEAAMRDNNTINLLMALRKLNRVNVKIAQVIRAILDGEIVPCGKGEKTGLASFLFAKNLLDHYANEQRRSQIGQMFCATEAAKRLGVTRDAIYFLTRKGILSSQQRTGKGASELLISKEYLECFEASYLLPAKVATRLGTISGFLTGLLIAKGVQPISGPKVDGGRQYVFKKSDLAGMNVEELIAASKSKALIRKNVNSAKSADYF
jgi:hypothetical protein